MTNSLKILVIDDDVSDRIAIKDALKEAGVSVEITEATSCHYGLSLLEQYHYDAVLLDYFLAGEKGLDLLKEVNDRHLNHSPIIMVNNFDKDDTSLNCLELGAQDCLLKSELNPAILLRTIRYAKERHRSEQRLRYLAEYDQLTGLANRSLFIKTLDKSLSKAKSEKYNVAVIYIDLDNFKDINNSLGHNSGDEILKHITQRLKLTCACHTMIARMGGDEFAMLVEYASHELLENIANKMLKLITSPINLGKYQVIITCSAGIATYPYLQTEAKELLLHADCAMYHAKKHGRNNYCFYTDELEYCALESVTYKKELYHALINKEFTIAFQPQVDAKSRSIIGVEALIRWQHPNKGVVSPAKFIPIAEETGLITSIGDWIFYASCIQLKQWLNKYPQLREFFHLAINVSVIQIEQQDFVTKVKRVLRETGVPAHCISIEVTEDIMVNDFKHCCARLRELAKSGIRIHIDDFGTGYASFNHLSSLPIQTIKIDRSFISEALVKQEQCELVKAMVSMGHALNMDVIAEGVDQDLLADKLENIGCDTLQGFLFGQPMAAIEIEQYFSQQFSLSA